MSEVRLIDANRLIKSIEDNRFTAENVKSLFCITVKAQPTVDAVPVRHGEWLRTEAFPHRIYCSVCYKTYVPNDRWQIWEDDELPKNYCPNCGAKMDGADGERR